MSGQKEAPTSDTEFIDRLVRRTRITVRWQLRRLKRWWRKFDRTTGEEVRTKTRDWVDTARESGEAEFLEFSDDTKKRYTRAKPIIDAKLLELRRLFRLIGQKIVAGIRYVMGVVFLAIVVFGIIWIFGAFEDNTDTSSSLIRCENCQSLSVTRIIDGDTIDTDVGRVRIYGADTPERGEKCFDEATDAMRKLAGNQIRAETGPRVVDPSGRALFYIYTESGDSIDEYLVRNGFAVAWTGDGQYRDLLVDLESTARANNIGCLWGQ